MILFKRLSNPNAHWPWPLYIYVKVAEMNVSDFIFSLEHFQPNPTVRAKMAAVKVVFIFLIFDNISNFCFTEGLVEGIGVEAPYTVHNCR